MPEDDKVGHILKGIADDAFNLLMCRNCSTVDAIIKECRRFEQAKSRRIGHSFARLPNTAATSSCEDRTAAQPSVPPDQLTRIVRRELEAMTPAPVHACDSSSITAPFVQAIVRQELANMGIHSVCTVASPTQTSWRPPSSYQEQRYATRYRDPAAWRTPDDRPICFTCHRIGHVARYCATRWSSAPRTLSTPYRRPESTRIPPSTQTYFPNDGVSPRISSRSPSPRGHQSRSPPGRRPSSRSPQTRRPSSPFNPARAYQEN